MSLIWRQDPNCFEVQSQRIHPICYTWNECSRHRAEVWIDHEHLELKCCQCCLLMWSSLLLGVGQAEALVVQVFSILRRPAFLPGQYAHKNLAMIGFNQNSLYRFQFSPDGKAVINRFKCIF